jgi:predicted dehydrogenase
VGLKDAAMTQPIKIAFVGAGNMAREHARAFRDLPGVILAGVTGRSRPRAESLAAELGIAEVFDSVDELHARTGADLVVVTVRELGMREAALACFRHDWLVLLEKPAGYNLPDAETILAAARERRRRVFVALNRRSYASTRRALELLAQGSGGARLVHVQDQQDLALAASLGEPPEVLRNYMFANSIHLVDYLRVFGRGDIATVNVLEPWNGSEPGVVAAHLRFDSGDVAIYQAVWNGPGPWAVTVTDPAQRLEIRPLEALSLQKRGERRLQAVELEKVDSEFKPGLRVQAQRVLEVVRGGAGKSLATLEDATESMRLCARIYGMHE